jgi:hypothetical protein
MAQVAECLPSNPEALSSNRVMPKTKQNLPKITNNKKVG